MNSPALPPFPSASADSPAWDAIRLICRRLAVLRSTGRSEEAASIEQHELPRAVAEARLHDAAADETAAAILARESSRVADASVLADLLVPLLVARLRDELPASAPARAPVSPELTAPAGPPAAPRRTAPAEVPGIADMIDGMLSQQRPARSRL